MSLSEQEKKALDEFKVGVYTSIKDRCVFMQLFGSKTRNDAVADSDIDVLVVVKEKNRVIENAVMDQAFEINMQYDLYISPRIISVSDYENPLFRVTPFYKNISREAVAL